MIKPRMHTNPHELTLEPSCKFVKTSGQIFCDMEGKGVLFKRFADIDVFDIEIDTQDPEELIRTVMLLEPTFGGINLEDIKAPECFQIERTLKKEMNIPVFHSAP